MSRMIIIAAFCINNWGPSTKTKEKTNASEARQVFSYVLCSYKLHLSLKVDPAQILRRGNRVALRAQFARPQCLEPALLAMNVPAGYRNGGVLVIIDADQTFEFALCLLLIQTQSCFQGFNDLLLILVRRTTRSGCRWRQAGSLVGVDRTNGRILGGRGMIFGRRIVGRYKSTHIAGHLRLGGVALLGILVGQWNHIGFPILRWSINVCVILIYIDIILILIRRLLSAIVFDGLAQIQCSIATLDERGHTYSLLSRPLIFLVLFTVFIFVARLTLPAIPIALTKALICVLLDLGLWKALIADRAGARAA